MGQQAMMVKSMEAQKSNGAHVLLRAVHPIRLQAMLQGALSRDRTHVLLRVQASEEGVARFMDFPHA